jgi:hypothetical protein
MVKERSELVVSGINLSENIGHEEALFRHRFRRPPNQQYLYRAAATGFNDTSGAGKDKKVEVN